MAIVECTCSARSEVARSPLLTALFVWCSLMCCIRILPVCPMCVQGQLYSAGIMVNYTWSILLGDWVFRVHVLGVVIGCCWSERWSDTKGDRAHLMASEVH